MKVAIDLTSLADNFSGIERYAANMAAAIIKQDSANDYVLLFKEAVFPMFEGGDEQDNVSFVIMPRTKCGKFFSTQIFLPRYLNAVNADVALFLAFPAPLLYFGRSISTIHDLCCWDCPETMTVKSRLLWRSLDRKAVCDNSDIISISNFSKSRIVAHYGIDERKVIVAYCGIDSEVFKPYKSEEFRARVLKRYSLPPRFILSLSTLEPRKDLPTLVDAWSSLVKEHDFEYDLVLAGRRGWKLDNLLGRLDNETRQRVHVTGFIEDEDLPVLYGLCDIFVFPSKYEGFGLPPVEALYSGAKVICSDIPCLREICGNAASFFSCGSSQSLAHQILLCLDEESPDIRKVMQYSWRKEAAKIIAAVNRCS